MGGWDLPRSEWHNPFTVKDCGSAEKAVAKYEEYINKKPELLARVSELRGKVLGCWCKKKPSDRCHGDVLARLADAATTAAAKVPEPIQLSLPRAVTSAAKDSKKEVEDKLSTIIGGYPGHNAHTYPRL